MITWKINEEKDYRRVREQVFIQEQGFQKEFDEMDAYATHVTLYKDHQVVGCGRVFSPLHNQSYVLGRLAILKPYRSQGYGAMIVHKLEDCVKAEGGIEIRLHAQVHAVPFYEKLGYVVCSSVDMDEHVPHLYMKKRL